METIQNSSPKYLNKHRSDSIIAWLRTHSLLSKSALCAKADYEYRDFEKVWEGKMTIKASRLDAFEQELMNYGYTPPGKTG